MKFRRIWTLRGPNRWARFPVIEAELDLESDEERRFKLTPTLEAKLLVGLPSLNERRDTIGTSSVSSVSGCSLPVLFARVVAHLQTLAGVPTPHQQAHSTREHDFFRIVFSFEEAPLALAVLDEAKALLEAIIQGSEIDTTVSLDRLRHLAHHVRLGPSTASIVRAAKLRGIPCRRLSGGSLVLLGWGYRQHRILTAETDQTSAISEAIAQDKDLTRALLRSMAVPVPEGRPVADADDAWRAAEELGVPAVVKPQYGNQGRGVATNLMTKEQVLDAYQSARAESQYVMVEQYLPGKDHRVLVIGGKLVAAALREPAHVVGDGKSTIRQLVAEVNTDPRRSDGHATCLSFIKIDPIAEGVLAEQGLTANSIPTPGQYVLIRRNANLSTGGTATDVTDVVHPEVARRAIDAARVVGLDVAGIDVVAEDLSRPLEDQRGGIVEVNAGPGLRMHLEPSAGHPRDVGSAIVDSLFPSGQTGRIPVIAVTGVNGKTTTTRLIAHVLRHAGQKVGMTSTDGMYLEGRRTDTHDCSGPQSARAVLLNPNIEVAVLETARGGILREGLAFEHCDVGIVTNIGKGDHLGLRGIDTLEELAQVKRVVIEAVAPNGAAVLNATDPLVAQMASFCPGQVIWFATDPATPVLANGLAQRGDRAVTVRNHEIVLLDGTSTIALLPIRDIPLTQPNELPFQVENVLATAAALWQIGIELETIRSGLRSFHGPDMEAPSRFNVIESHGRTVILDYAHNPSAVFAMATAVERFPPGHRTLVTTGSNRLDADLIEMGEIIGNTFDRVVLYDDCGHSGRTDGELNEILKVGLGRGQRVKHIVEKPTEREAIDVVLRGLEAGQLAVFGVEALEDSLSYVQTFLQGWVSYL